MVLNTQTPHPIYNQQPRTTMQDTSKIRKKTQHAHNHKKKNSNQPCQNYYYFHFYFKTKQKRPSGAVRTAKRTKEALRQIFRAIITI
jgi:hypothetical protein